MARASDTFDLTKRLAASARTDDVTGLAAEIAYRSLLELFPFFVFLATIDGVLESTFHIQNPVHQILDLLTNSMPQGAADPIRQQLEHPVADRPRAQISKSHGARVRKELGAQKFGRLRLAPKRGLSAELLE